MTTITARYAGTCANCGRHIDAGTRVRWSRGRGISCLDCNHAAALDATAALDVCEIVRWYRCGEMLGVVYRNSDSQLCSTLVCLATTAVYFAHRRRSAHNECLALLNSAIERWRAAAAATTVPSAHRSYSRRCNCGCQMWGYDGCDNCGGQLP